MCRYLAVVSHDVAEPRKESGARCNLWMHRTVDIIQQIQCLTNQLVAFVKETLLDLGLTAREHVIGITRLTQQQLSVPRHNLSFGARSFRVAAPKIWNSIHLHIRQSQTYSSFRRHLKTHFQSASLSFPLAAP